MMIDLTIRVSAKANDAVKEYDFFSGGHVGTHFDVMNKEFPLEYFVLDGVVFDVKHVRGRDIRAGDIEFNRLCPGMFAAFYTGFGEQHDYGSAPYFKEHPELAHELIDKLLDLGVSIIGVDCAGVRRGKEHKPADQKCADRGAFVIENLCRLDCVLGGAASAAFTAYTFPLHFEGLTGLPCRVAAETKL